MRTHITAHYRGSIVRVAVDQITRFQSGDKYVTAHYPDGELVTEEKMKNLEAEFPEFIRVHRFHLVRRALVHEYQRIDHNTGQIILTGMADPIPVSFSQTQAVKALFDEGVTSCDS